MDHVEATPAVAAPADDCDAMRTLLHLPEDALVAVLTCALDAAPIGLAASLRATASALVCSCHFFAHGLGALALERAGLAAVGRLLGVSPSSVPRVTGYASPLDAILFTLRSHETAAPVACGGNHTLLLVPLPGRVVEGAPAARIGARPSASASLLSCGSNDAAQLGNGSRAMFNAAVAMPTLPYDAIEYTARRSRQLERSDPSFPCPVDGLSNSDVAAVAAGHAHSLALTHCGEVYAWGDTGSGQCGAPPPRVTILTPHRLPFFDGRAVAHIAAGQLHSAFLLASGQVYCCGENSSGQLGVVDDVAAGVMALSTPRPVCLPEIAISIAAGGFHTLAICGGPRRHVWGWGSGSAGQLGVQGVRRLSAPPTLAAPATNAGPAAALPPGNGGGGGAGGVGAAAEPGLPSFEHAAVPTLVHGGLLRNGPTGGAARDGWTGGGRFRGTMSGAAGPDAAPVEIAGEIVGGAGACSSVGTAAHRPQVRGSISTTTGESSLALLPPCAQLAAGMYHSLFLTVDGVAMRSGGEFGPYHASTVHAPQPIAALRGQRVVRVAAGGGHSCFVTADGALWTCGVFKYGRLGLPAGIPPSVSQPPHPDAEAVPHVVEGEASRPVEAVRASGCAASAPGVEPAGAVPAAIRVGSLLLSSDAGDARTSNAVAQSSAGDGPAPSTFAPIGASPATAAAAASAPHPLLAPTDNDPRRVPLPPGLRVRWVGAGGEHTVVLFTDHAEAPLCFGRNVFGQLGTGDRRPRGYPAGVVAIPEGGVASVRDGLSAAILSTELGEVEARSHPPGVQGNAAADVIPEGEGDGLKGEKGAAAATPICRVLSRWG